MDYIKEYRDAFGNLIEAGDIVTVKLSGETKDEVLAAVSNGNRKTEKVFKWQDGNRFGLGLDATNPSWIERGIAFPCEYGVYPLTNEDLLSIVVVSH